MEGLLTFLAVLLVVGILIVPVILIVMVGGLRSQIDLLNRRFQQLYQELKDNANLESEKTTEPVHKTPVSVYTTDDHRAYMPQVSVSEQPETEVEPHNIPTPDEIEIPPVKEEVISNQPEPEIIPGEEVPVTETGHQQFVEEVSSVETAEQTGSAITGQSEKAKPQPQPQQPKGSFNFEKFIGENLINKIGIGVLVIGIGLFVKYAIDHQWINETGRVIVGFLSGGVLLALAYRFRNAYRAFSSVLTGGAMAVFYFTVAIAFREYGLFGQTPSFLMMVVITAFSVWLSILYNRRELAVLSLIGGMLTPFMVSRGDGNYHVLFTYIAVLDIGMLALSLRKQWKELIVISFIGTQLIFWLYYLQDMFGIRSGNTARDTALLLYASVFYVIFLLMPLIQVFRGKDQSKNHALHIILLIANSFLYLTAGVLLLNRMGAVGYKGLLVALLAVVNAVVAVLLYNNRKDKVLFHLFSGLTISFVTLAAPMQFDGSSITLFWATEAVLLLWLLRKSGAAVYYWGAFILLAFTFFSMLALHDTQSLSYDGNIRAAEGIIFINRYFITRLYASLAFVAAYILLRRYYSQHAIRPWELPAWISTVIGIIAAVLLFYTGSRELYMYTDTNNYVFWRMAYIQVFTLSLSVIVGYRAVSCRFRFFSVIALWAIACLSYWTQSFVLGYQVELLADDQLPVTLPTLLYWVGFAGLCILFVQTARVFYLQYTLKSSQGKTFMWFFNAVAVINVSIAIVEAIHQITLLNNLYLSNKTSVTILWSLCAFVQMWVGMKLKYKTLRIISLSLLGLVLCKLFMFDLSNVSQGAKIVAFVVLGIVLLVLSFLYQKLKKILFEDDEENKDVNV